MSLNTKVCDNCGGDLDVKDDGGFLKCAVCRGERCPDCGKPVRYTDKEGYRHRDGEGCWLHPDQDPADHDAFLLDPDEHDPGRPYRLLDLELITEQDIEETCCCMVGYNGCCYVCHRKGKDIRREVTA